MTQKNLLHLLELHGNPRCVRWGCHEGIRGAYWIEVHADGSIHRRHYIPNADAATTSEKLGLLPKDRFQELVTQIAAIRFEQLDTSCPPAPSTTSLSLECVWDESRWEFLFPSFRLSDCDPMNHLAETFRQLAEDAYTHSNDCPSQGMQ